MSFKKSLFLMVLAALVFASALWFTATRSLPAVSGGVYAILSVDEFYPDRYIGTLLSRGGIENYISQSTQWVFLDDFGELKQVPLDSYGDLVASFDPRHDGYAEQLNAFFIRGGKRLFFIPLSRGGAPSAVSGLTDFERRLVPALEGIPHSLEFTGSSRSFFPQYLLFGVAAALTLILMGTPVQGAALISVLAALLFSGPSGFALSALLMALSAVLREPLGEFFSSRRYGSSDRMRGCNIQLRAFRFSWLLALAFVLFYGIILYFVPVPFFLGFSVLAAFLCVFALSRWAESNRGKQHDHVRFRPLPIRDSFAASPRLNRTMIPFACAAVLALLPPALGAGNVAVPAPSSPGGFLDDGFIVSRAEYEEHAAFQAAFSELPLGRAPSEASYMRYERGADGLIAAGEPDGGAAPEIPPFPLESLMAFLGGYEQQPVPAYTDTRGEYVSVLVVLLLGIAALFKPDRGHRKKGRYFVYSNKRIAA